MKLNQRYRHNTKFRPICFQNSKLKEEYCQLEESKRELQTKNKILTEENEILESEQRLVMKKLKEVV